MIDLVGQKFGRLSVTKYCGNNRQRNATFECECDCGNKKIVASGKLRNMEIRSCGCLRDEQRIKHGKHGSPTYECWGNMISRCTNPKHPNYADYGGRGIVVCERWKSFENFLADMGERPSKMTLDRKNNDGNYEVGNCQWASQKEQTRNRRCNVMILFNGERKCLSEWAELTGINRDKLRTRIRYGWSVERMLTTK